MDGVVTLDRAELLRRARRVKLILSDVDGVLTDAGVYYSSRGEELKRFSLRDGMAVELLRAVNVETGFLSREESACVRQRALKLQLRHVYLGVWDKLGELPAILANTGLSVSELGYIGDDVNDVPLLAAIAAEGLTAAPHDARPEALAHAQIRTASAGGHGAFRDFADSILTLRTEEQPS